ncbi:DinB family protein [Pedobacter cryoconitis]|uniref:Putative damage-inducible protein DinB n=1 Tax=Pedobacter cryoconitis TaxID=188932 RepID=A0A7X0J687_9SPHI|nr:DinB family protein [Pedobacter cryoconitis]MBB6501414.1 putative damage-inducible protein DinB [Pedobacter cryoconitis]
METQQELNALSNGIMTSGSLFNHWQGHRRVTRRLIEIFPEEQLFEFSIGGMRSFADMVKEISGLSGIGMRGLVTGDWTSTPELDYRSGKSVVSTKAELLCLWDEITVEIDSLWPQIPYQRFHEVIQAFVEYEGYTLDIILYWIDNEVHHRAQGYVYLRALGIEPPAFWNRD